LSLAGEKDYWVVLGPREERLENLSHLLSVGGDLFFEYFSSIEKIATVLKVDSISEGMLPGCFGMLTKSRLALLGMKVCVFLNDFEGAKKMAEYGLSVAGMAVSLKREFRAILAIS